MPLLLCCAHKKLSSVEDSVTWSCLIWTRKTCPVLGLGWQRALYRYRGLLGSMDSLKHEPEVYSRIHVYEVCGSAGAESALGASYPGGSACRDDARLLTCVPQLVTCNKHGYASSGQSWGIAAC